MSALFLKILNLSITASYVIAAVVLLRLIFRKKAPKKLICALWTLVGLRLVFPVSLESVLSLIPSAETVPPEIVSSPAPQIASGFATVNSVVNPVLSGTFAPATEQSVRPMQVLTEVGAWVWIVGVLAVCLYGLISYVRLKRKMADAVLLSGNIFQSEKAESPFILGFYRPKIYLPFSLSDTDRENVIAHETAHIKRKDHIIKPLAFLLLAVYWFNPLVLVSYVLLCRDIELACDEKVIRDLSEDSRKVYAKSLLDCAVKRKSIAACPLAFGEVGVKTRIKGVMNYKKPAFWVIIITVAAIIITSVCFLTNPKKDEDTVGSSDFDSVTVYESQTDYDGDVTLTLIEASVRSESPYFTVRLKNGTDKELLFGEQFYLTKDDSETSLTQGDRIFHTIGYAVKPGEECDHTYTLEGYDLSEKGNYTFSIPFTIDGDEKEYKVSLGFGLTDDMPSKAQNTTYIASEAIWENGYFSSLAATGMQYWITDDGELLTNVDESLEPYESRWASLGTLTKSDLTLEKFKSFTSSLEWSYAVTPEQLFEENEEILHLKSDTATYTDYYLLRQKNGDLYLATAFDEKSFRAVYKLSAVEAAADATQAVWTGTEYRMTDAESGKTVPTLTLNRKDNSFSFTFDPLSSYLSYGTYEQVNGKIICKTDDGQYKYVFKATDEATLVFDKKASSPVKVTDSKIANKIKDGAVFSAKTDTRKPFADLTESKIEKITVSAYPPGKDIDLSAGQVKTTVTLLSDLKIYQFDNSFSSLDGQTVSFFIAKKDGTAVQLDVLSPFAVIDSAGYLADEETLEKLNAFANEILK